MWRRRVLVLVSVLVVGGFALSAWLLRPHHARVSTANQAPATPGSALAGEHKASAQSQPRVETPTVLQKGGATPAPRRVTVEADAAPRRAVTVTTTARRAPSISTRHHTRATHPQKARPRHATKSTPPVRHVTATRHHAHHGDLVRNFFTSLVSHHHH